MMKLLFLIFMAVIFFVVFLYCIERYVYEEGFLNYIYLLIGFFFAILSVLTLVIMLLCFVSLLYV